MTIFEVREPSYDKPNSEIMKVAPSRLHPSPREPPSFPAPCLKHVLGFFFFVLWGRVAAEAVLV